MEQIKLNNKKKQQFYGWEICILVEKSLSKWDFANKICMGYLPSTSMFKHSKHFRKLCYKPVLQQPADDHKLLASSAQFSDHQIAGSQTWLPVAAIFDVNLLYTLGSQGLLSSLLRL